MSEFTESKVFEGVEANIFKIGSSIYVQTVNPAMRLNKIYEAAKLGLKGDALALASGMLPTEYRQLCELDPIANMAADKGKADGELEMSMCLHKAAKEGDAKAALAILQHSHGWVAKQSISIDVDQRISILGALRQAETRVIDVLAHEPSPQLEQTLNAEHHLQR